MSRAGSLIPLAVVLTYGCTTPSRKSADPIVRTETIERLKPVATPCEERVKGFLDALANPNTAITPEVEGKVEAITRSDSAQREYVKRLEAAAIKCGVVIEH
jgi:hypothetical protein